MFAPKKYHLLMHLLNNEQPGVPFLVDFVLNHVICHRVVLTFFVLEAQTIEFEVEKRKAKMDVIPNLGTGSCAWVLFRKNREVSQS